MESKENIRSLEENEMIEFEKWFLEFRKDWKPWQIHRVCNETSCGYLNSYMNSYWDGWIARAKLNSSASIHEAKKRFSESEPLPFGGYPGLRM